MGLKSTHPEYTAMSSSWVQMRDFYAGEEQVKSKGVSYLPATSGMEIDGMEAGGVGKKSYDAYKARALFPDYVKEGVEALIGLLHQKPAKIELPESMQYLLSEATIDGENIYMLLRKINEEQIISGRLGILADLPKDPDPSNPKVFLAMYAAETIVNWDEGASLPGVNELNMVVLNESGNVRDNFEWKWVEKYRVLQLGTMSDTEETALYRQGVFKGDNYDESLMIAPMFRGATLDKIPFVFVNSKDLISSPDKPPMKGLGELCLSIYRGEADYRQNLHMQGQDTLVTIGGVRNSSGVPGNDEDAVRVGAGSRIDVDIAGDAKYIGTSAAGLAEQRSCLENDRKRAESRAGQLVGNQSIKNESGNAMLARLAAQTASLNQIAMASAAGLERILKLVATWRGEDPAKVKVEPSLEFSKMAETAQEFVYLMTARSLGAPISLESIHETMKDRGYTKFGFEEEVALVKKEGPGIVDKPIDKKVNQQTG